MASFTDADNASIYRVQSLHLGIDVSSKSKENEDMRLTMPVSFMAQKNCDQFKIEIDTNVTLLYMILFRIFHVYYTAKVKKICDACHSKWVLFVSILFMFGYLLVNSIINLFYYAWIKLFLLFGYLFTSLIVVSSLNYQIFRYKIGTFILWLKISDMVQFFIGMT